MVSPSAGFVAIFQLILAQPNRVLRAARSLSSDAGRDSMILERHHVVWRHARVASSCPRCSTPHVGRNALD